MTLGIDKVIRGEFTIFLLSGRIEFDHIPELTRLFESGKHRERVVLDLKETKLVDRDTIKFLIHCEAQGMKLENCSAYIHEWMEREKC